MHPLENLESLRFNRSIVLTIGVFDGVHLGHQYLIEGGDNRARELGGLGVVLTFHPHPQLVLNPSLQPAYLTTLDERLGLIASLGIDLTIALRFTVEMARVTAQDFVSTLCRAFPLVELRVGPDFALGHKRQGTIAV
ncbi:MAG: FAD synthetase family protein, partial [Chloroflexi bacterium]|nr:FAD synthetase family protein [Chloroflexota bacterium]